MSLTPVTKSESQELKNILNLICDYKKIKKSFFRGWIKGLISFICVHSCIMEVESTTFLYATKLFFRALFLVLRKRNAPPNRFFFCFMQPKSMNYRSLIAIFSYLDK